MISRWEIIGATALSVSLIVLPVIATWSPRVLWNVSASVPVGLYRLHPVERLAIGDLVAVAPPPALSDFLASRGHLPRGVPLLKHVVALQGALVCRSGGRITVDDRALGDAHVQDSVGRALPIWQGCHRLGAGEVFLMNPDAPDSLDGRYFGPLPLTTIAARLTPLWTVSGRSTGEAVLSDPTPRHNRKEARHAPDR